MSWLGIPPGVMDSIYCADRFMVANSVLERSFAKMASLLHTASGLEFVWICII
jgi:hypothetical protein